MAKKGVRCEVYQRRDGLFDWRVRARNDLITAGSASQGFSTRSNGRRGAHAFLRSLGVDGEVPVIDVWDAA